MTSTDLSWLSAKQKRLKTWQEFAKNEIQDKNIKIETEALLKDFSEVLLNIWEKSSYDSTDLSRVEDLERRLEQLNEESRLRVLPSSLAASPRN